MIHFFLDKVERRKLELFRYLEKSPSQKDLREIIVGDLNISDFLLNKIIEELHLDLDKYGLTNKFNIQSDNTFVELTTYDNFTSNQLKLYFVKDSLAFSLFIELFLERFNSVNDYADNNFISYSSVYKKLKEMRNFFKKIDFTITKDFKLRGDEKKIRLFLLHLFIELNGQNYDIYPDEIKEMTTRFLSHLEKKRQKPLREFSKIRLYHFLSISFFRINQHHSLRKDSLHVSRDYLSNNDYAQFISELLQSSELNIKEDRILYETDEILAFLVAKDILVFDNYLDKVSRQHFRIYSFNFMNEVKNHFPDLSEFIDDKSEQIDLVHFNALNFVICNNEESKNIDIDSFSNNYMDYIDFSKTYIYEQKSNQEFWRLKKFFFYKYLLILVNASVSKINKKPIYLYVDFSAGDKYTDLIIDNIKRFTDFQITYQDFIDERTSIILSDIYFENYNNISQIIWENCPEPVDWQDFVITLETYAKNSE